MNEREMTRMFVGRPLPGCRTLLEYNRLNFPHEGHHDAGSSLEGLNDSCGCFHDVLSPRHFSSTSMKNTSANSM
jgi:hypothetical protein